MPKPGGSWLTISSTCSIASPELTPGAASPTICIAGAPLKRSRRGELCRQCEVAKAVNGTICPSRLRTYQRSKSCGTMRKGASACRMTRLTRPRSMKSST